MYKAEPNNTKHNERPFLVRNDETGKIVRYCFDREEADGHAARINKAIYPGDYPDAVQVANVDPRHGAGPGENLSLF